MKKLFTNVKRFSSRIALIEQKILLSLLYITLAPFAILYRKTKKNAFGYVPWSLRADTLEELQSQG